MIQRRRQGHTCSRFSALTSTTGTLWKLALIFTRKEEHSHTHLTDSQNPPGIPRNQDPAPHNALLTANTWDHPSVTCKTKWRATDRKVLQTLQIYALFYSPARLLTAVSQPYRQGLLCSCEDSVNLEVLATCWRLKHEVDGGSNLTNGTVH